MIEIHGLNQRQYKLADLLWQTQDVEQYHVLLASLQGRDRIDAHGITEIMIQEYLWENLDEDLESRELSSTVIDRARSS
jgi:hypothetical protein